MADTGIARKTNVATAALTVGLLAKALNEYLARTPEAANDPIVLSIPDQQAAGQALVADHNVLDGESVLVITSQVD